jgi:hypothetical protein
MRVAVLGQCGGPAVGCWVRAQAGAWQAGRGPLSAAAPHSWLRIVAFCKKLEIRITEAILSKFECFHLNVKFKSLFKF